MVESIMQKLKKTEIFCKKTIDFAKNDFKKRYAGSNLGILWAYIQTIVMVLIYWIVFQFGLKNGSVEGVPFLPWFITGMMPWLLFSDIINTTMNCMFEYSYIVKKVVFNVDIIPASKVAVCIFIHIFFVAVIVAVTLCHGIYTGLYIIQLLFYLIADLLLAVPLAYAACTISVFFKDFGQIVSILLNIFMWATPIVWDFSAISERLQWIFKLNPVFFVINGFRNSLIYGISFLEDIPYLFYFIGVVCALWAICIPLYRRLLPHLADVL